jgi:hypothetical protein
MLGLSFDDGDSFDSIEEEVRTHGFTILRLASLRPASNTAGLTQPDLGGVSPTAPTESMPPAAEAAHVAEDSSPPSPPNPKWVAVSLNLLAHSQLSIPMVAAQVEHASARDGKPISFEPWLSVLERSEAMSIQLPRVLALQEALKLDPAAI